MSEKLYNDALYQMRKAWYVWQMAVSKSRIKVATKGRLLRKFEDSVLFFAEVIKAERARLEQIAAIRYAEGRTDEELSHPVG